jgi:hypothetical protein
MLEGVAEEVATAQGEVEPEVARYLEAGGDLRSARDLLIAGGRRGCTGPCAPALLNAARDACNAGRDADASTSLVLDAVNDAVAWRLTTDHVVTDVELGYAVRAATARSL